MAFKLALFHQPLAKPDVFLTYFLYLTEDRLFFCITCTLFEKQKIIIIMIIIIIIIIIIMREEISFKASLWLSTQSGSFQFTSIAENSPN